MSSHLQVGPRQREVLSGWREVGRDRPAGPGYDFTAPAVSESLRAATEAFRADPTEEAFEALWIREHLPGALLASSGLVLNSWDYTVDELGSFVGEVVEASAYDRAWETAFPEVVGLWEFYTRLHPDGFVVDGSTKEALAKFGYTGPREFEPLREAVEEFADIYRDAVGSVTEGTDHEVPLQREIDEFSHLLVNRVPDTIREQLLDAGRTLYRPLIGWDGSELSAARIDLDTARLDAVLDAYPDDPAEVYGWTEHDDRWGGSHAEVWKHDYSAHVQERVVGEFDLGNLEPADVEPLLDRYDDSDPTDLSTSGLRKLMGGQHGSMQVDRFVEEATGNPEVAAAVLGDLFSPGQEYRGSRLAAFDVAYGAVIDSPGQTMRLATTLLMVTFPQEYISYQYGRLDTFFGDIAGYDVATGFNPDEYHYLNAACLEIKERLQERQPDASMLDVQSLIWVYADDDETRVPRPD